ncbi:Fe(3+)-hydroxamate ABC transporter permease FhuB [Falsirhodobacter sp. 20TX0035]|uniref:Fe(3+)-hydroxamate ABC transporter permease FhuB n=1 Tax=Falsirhodobacter sp. 20TX0035 TaxID=3022019 RepID=UPI002330B0CA|nr:Fe(3+)-hydroxamate ABC transporter permease FhuB [Falsirhodobacter sp. 20TX0035]MDB6454979.1 Fe(3+)-hydroxamate ABC transporter permease FhuB [Falsirhodobacter sp. 20TX0035]
MIRALPFFLAAGVAAALWVHAALTLVPLSDWPAWPFDPDTMTLPQILLAFGQMPRGVVALLVGAALGLSGAVLQAVLRNPAADPTTLGISSGAQLAVVVATIFAPGVLDGGRWPVALAGAGIAAGLVVALGARRAFAPVTMVIAGLLVGLTAASLSTAITLAQGEYLLTLVMWNSGSLVQQDWSTVRGLAAVLAVCAVGAALLARPLRVLSLGEGASALGLNVAGVRLAVIGLAVWLAASVTAAVGLVVFVGLAAPAIARAAGARRHGQVLLVAPLAGALLLSLCDGAVLWVAGAGGEMFPTGAVTGLIGGPLLLWLTMRMRVTVPPQRDGGGAVPRLSRPLPVLALLAGALALAVLALIWVGRVPGGWVVLDAQSFADFLPTRLPRLAAAGAAGAILALAGAILQRMTANPLASPEVLGVSGGASLGFALVVFLVAQPTAGGLLAGTMAGGAVVLAVVGALALRAGATPERLLLAGIALSSLASAVLSAMMSLGDARSWKVLEWLGGSSAAVTPTGAGALCILAVVALALALAMTRWLAVMPLGDGVAGALGLPLRRVRLALILLAGFGTGAATLLVGPLSFVGLMAPHIARRSGFARPAGHLAGSALIGALLMILSDFGARMATFPYELPLGLFASLIGAPYLVWLILRRHA